ncbi:anaphase-promoting complex subunit 5-domain-containing protein [Kalaharituber pfeilii]|nr:anaphase-promoting complex subunit 5-domain-containing protein [Kalaharituber pfeilii]
MSRYLTPGKIALLCLVELYAESKFPHQSILPVLSFVLKHIVSPKDTTGFILTLDQIKQATVNEPSAVVGRTIFDLLLKKLWEIDSFDALHSFFTNLETYLIDTEGANRITSVRVHGEKSPLSRTSVLGCFVRRAALEHVRLAFTDAVALWKLFIDYREPTLPLWKKRNLGAGPLSFDVNLKGLSLEDELFNHVYGRLKDSRDCHVSTDDVERLLEFQVDAMQRMGTRIPCEIQEQLQQMLQTNVTIPSLSHYVEFLNSWKAGDYAGAFDNLHRYFDYTMQNRDRTFYQYALLNLAILQADFGCYRESVLAMQETINTARENKDMACLNFSLSWFYHFHKAHPQDCPEVISSRMERESLQFLKAKAKEAGMHHLQSMAHLSEAKQLLVGGESIPAAFESILRSSHLNITKNIHNAMGSQILLQSAIWGRLGISYLSWMNCELFLAKYKAQSPIEDAVKALCRGSYIISMRGRFDEAFERLEEVDQESLRTLKVYQYWATYIGLLKLRRAIYRGDIASADMLLEQLAASPLVEPDCALEIAMAKIDLQMRRGNFAAAFTSITNLADELARDRADIYHRIRLMTLKAQLLAKCGRAPKALSLAMRAAAISWRSRLLPMLFQSFCVISNILIQLSEFETAYSLMDRIMPQVLECEDAFLNAQCFSVLADSLVGLAGQKEGEKRREELHKGLEFIDRASTEYARIGDSKTRAMMTAQKARIMDYLGDRSVRDDAVKLYVQLKRAC